LAGRRSVVSDLEISKIDRLQAGNHGRAKPKILVDQAIGVSQYLIERMRTMAANDQTQPLLDQEIFQAIDWKTLGDIVKYFREKESLSQFDLADKAGVTHGYISIIESGNKDNVTPKVIAAIAEALLIKPHWLMSLAITSERSDNDIAILQRKLQAAIKKRIGYDV
jgi:transcriptional regulator with XRE-family HTH domain